MLTIHNSQLTTDNKKTVLQTSFIPLFLQPDFLSHSIKVVRQILILFVEVRILVGQLKLKHCLGFLGKREAVVKL